MRPFLNVSSLNFIITILSTYNSVVNFSDLSIAQLCSFDIKAAVAFFIPFLVPIACGRALHKVQ